MRTILNFEAVLVGIGCDKDGFEAFEVQLMVNHHVIRRWPIAKAEASRMTKGTLDSFVSVKLFELLRPTSVHYVGDGSWNSI
jgi:poly(3-hydroxyalkanoate) synthetase